LPDNASQELEYSYDQALRILQGTSIEEILEENDRMMEEIGITVQVFIFEIIVCFLCWGFYRNLI
jgi:hypothetical protein